MLGTCRIGLLLVALAAFACGPERRFPERGGAYGGSGGGESDAGTQSTCYSQRPVADWCGYCSRIQGGGWGDWRPCPDGNVSEWTWCSGSCLTPSGTQECETVTCGAHRQPL